MQSGARCRGIAKQRGRLSFRNGRTFVYVPESHPTPVEFWTPAMTRTPTTSATVEQPLPYATVAGRIPAPSAGHADILAVGFGTAVAMWAVAYFTRLFGDALPAPVLFFLLVLLQLVGGFLFGRFSRKGVRGAVWAGMITGLINLLVVGSLIGGDTPSAIRMGAVLWVPGTLAGAMLLAALGALVGRLRSTQEQVDWTGSFGAVVVVATFVLLAAGGLVTGYDEGLAVPDWPNTEGYNMFLYPLSRMTGGIFLEHAHRLLGSLVGLSVLVMALHATLTEQRKWLHWWLWGTFLLVVGQGVLGGLRVTGVLTLSADPSDLRPSIVLAIVHGVFGQIVFALLVAAALLRSQMWHRAPQPQASPFAGTDRVFGIALVILLIVQLVLGALVRHFTWTLERFEYGLSVDVATLTRIGQAALHIHITLAVVVILLALAVGVRAWGLYRGFAGIRRLGVLLMWLAGVQVVLGVLALVVTANHEAHTEPTALDVSITTLHQVTAAALLGLAVLILLWNYRVARPQPSAITA